MLAYYIGGRNEEPYTATQHWIDLERGDRTVVHDDCPASWKDGDPITLLLHGLGGCHQSSYLRRIVPKLNRENVRTFRMDHRDCGTGLGHAKYPYHSGMTCDVMSAWKLIRHLCPNSPAAVVGYSMSGNMILLAAGQNIWPADDPASPKCLVALNPPIDLDRCSTAMSSIRNLHYNAHYVNYLFAQVNNKLKTNPDAPAPLWKKKPKTMRQFDDLYTAPASGFASAEDYYAKCSANRVVDGIRIPSYVLTSEDDPFIPSQQFHELPEIDELTIHMTQHGGHLGFLGCKGANPDRRWMDWRIIDWILPHLKARPEVKKGRRETRVTVGSTLRR